MMVPKLLVVASASVLVSLGVLLLFVLLYGGLDHALNEFLGDVTLRNTTDSLICIGTPNGPGEQCPPLTGGGLAEIKPRATRHWSTGPCSAGDIITLYELRTGRVIYKRGLECGGFDGATININFRDGEFVVADSVEEES